MTTHVYVLASTDDKKTEAQFDVIEEAHDAEYWFVDEATSQSTKVMNRPRFSALYKFVVV